MSKLKMHTPDLVADNLEWVAARFPGCITESRNEKGELVRAVDFDLLRQELSTEIVEGPQERYHLNWPGKREALLAANAPIAKTLRPCREESVDFDTTRNLFIEGDNLDALKLLQETYLNKVKMIYIDPPYNTGKDFIYADDFACNASEYLLRAEQLDAEGRRLVANTESNGRFHSDWLSMVLPRLRLSRTLLADDGIVFVSIDEHELDNLIKVGSEVFGDANFVGTFAVQCNPRGRHLDRFIATTHDYVVVFARNALNSAAISGLRKSGRMLDEYGRQDGRGKYRLLGLRNRNQAFNPVTRPNRYFPLYVNRADGSVSLLRSATHPDEVWPDAPDGTKTCWTWGKDKVEREGGMLVAEKSGSEWRIYRKDYLEGEDGEVALTMPKSLWLDKEMTNDYGRSRIKSLFGASVMDFPKSVQLLERLVELGCASDGLVVDFFAGSATTADAVMSVNARDGGQRRFLLVQVPEECPEGSKARSAGFTTIAELAKERIRRASKAIVKDAGLRSQAFDRGFRVLKIDSSNMKDVYYRPDEATPALLGGHVDNIKDDRTDEDLLFQVLLDWGVDLSLPVAKETIGGKTVYFVDTNALAASFETGLDEDFVKALAAREPLRVVFRDSGYNADDVKINVDQIFKQLSPGTEVKTL
ncbi:MAG: site-specific DNA-methyltransferase [Phycisphaerales bacterium JB054]